MSCHALRLVLRLEGAYLQLIQPEHIDALYELFESNRDYLRRNIPGIDSIRTRADFQQRWGTSTDNSLHFGLWLDDEQLIGRCRLTRYTETGCADIGYWLAESFQGRGLMTAAVEQLTTFAFEQWHVERVQIQCGENNRKSRSIPERLGFADEGVSQKDQPVELNGHSVRSVTYARLYYASI